MTLKEVCNETTRKILDNIDSVELTKQYPHIKEALDAFMSDSNTFLLIAVVSGKTTAKIYFFTKQNQTPTPIPIDTTKKNKIVEVYTKIRRKMKAEKSDCTQKDIVDSGNDLFQKLLDGVLPEKPDKEYGVWIYCEDKQINPLWEWICVKSKDEASENGKYFFWGDRFFIVRIPKEGIPEKGGFRCPNFKIGEVAILKDEKCFSWAEKEIVHLKSKTGVTPKEIPLSYSKGIKNLNGFNYIHVVADAEHRELEYTVENASEDKEVSNHSDFNGANIHKFLFLNILNTCIRCSLRAKLIELIPAKTWIYPILAVSEDFASKFAECFYESVAEENNVAKAVKKAREKIQNCDDVEDCKKFYRFAYVVSGNSYTQITFTDD